MINTIFPKILFIGLDYSGKTTIIKRLKDMKVILHNINYLFKDNEIIEIYPTPFIDVTNLSIDGKHFAAIEVSGNLRYRDYWENFYYEIDAIVFVIDGTDYQRLPIVKELITKLFSTISYDIPVEILINKSDIESCVNKATLRRYLELDFLNSKFKFDISSSIAFNSYGVKEAIKSITNNLCYK